jgi:branched-chain amino acid transport system permease protein
MLKRLLPFAPAAPQGKAPVSAGLVYSKSGFLGSYGSVRRRFCRGAFVLSAFLASAAGAVYVLLQGGASPGITTADFTLALLVMVVLGGVGTLWGAVVGGIVYEYLDFRLLGLQSAPLIQHLPAFVRMPLSQPLFVLGVLFIVLVLFVPGGLAAPGRRRAWSAG